MLKIDAHEKYRIREKFETTEIICKLQPYGEVEEDEKEKCYRFVPKDPDWPEAYIYGDGRVMVISEKHFADEIETFIRDLVDILGMEVVQAD